MFDDHVNYSFPVEASRFLELFIPLGPHECQRFLWFIRKRCSFRQPNPSVETFRSRDARMSEETKPTPLAIQLFALELSEDIIHHDSLIRLSPTVLAVPYPDPRSQKLIFQLVSINDRRRRLSLLSFSYFYRFQLSTSDHMQPKKRGIYLTVFVSSSACFRAEDEISAVLFYLPVTLSEFVERSGWTSIQQEIETRFQPTGFPFIRAQFFAHPTPSSRMHGNVWGCDNDEPSETASLS